MSWQSSDSSSAQKLTQPNLTPNNLAAQTPPTTPAAKANQPRAASRGVDPRREMAQKIAKERWASWAKKKFEE
jgi:hypothetical protein